jgi:hypothetical protein
LRTGTARLRTRPRPGPRINGGARWPRTCCIESNSPWSSKEVEFYRISAPEEKWFSFHCDPWVGTSECCSRVGALGLSYDECKQLRHEPDCPRPGGGGGGPGSPGETEIE